MKMNTAAEVTKKCKKSNDCRCGIGFKILFAVSFVITCYFVYRVTELESRVDYLERKFEIFLSSSNSYETVAVQGVDLLEKELPSRRKRDTADCQCPPGKLDENFCCVQPLSIVWINVCRLEKSDMDMQ